MITKKSKPMCQTFWPDWMKQISPVDATNTCNCTVYLFTGEFLCPDGWVVYGKNCLYVNSTRSVTWHQAVHKCQQLNATLTRVNDQEESKFIGSK